MTMRCNFRCYTWFWLWRSFTSPSTCSYPQTKLHTIPFIRSVVRSLTSIRTIIERDFHHWAKRKCHGMETTSQRVRVCSFICAQMSATDCICAGVSTQTSYSSLLTNHDIKRSKPFHNGSAANTQMNRYCSYCEPGVVQLSTKVCSFTSSNRFVFSVVAEKRKTVDLITSEKTLVFEMRIDESGSVTKLVRWTNEWE